MLALVSADEDAVHQEGVLVFRFAEGGLRGGDIEAADNLDIPQLVMAAGQGFLQDDGDGGAALTDDGWFRTNDLACMDSKGRYYIKGRLGNMIVGPSGENIYPEEIEQVINNMRGVNESLVIERDGKLVALVKFDENVIDWGMIEKEEKFFENLESWKKAVLDYVNKRVSKQSNIGEVDVMKEDFEKTATQKIRRFKYKFFKPEDGRSEEKKKN